MRRNCISYCWKYFYKLIDYFEAGGEQTVRMTTKTEKIKSIEVKREVSEKVWRTGHISRDDSITVCVECRRHVNYWGYVICKCFSVGGARERCATGDIRTYATPHPHPASAFESTLCVIYYYRIRVWAKRLAEEQQQRQPNSLYGANNNTTLLLIVRARSYALDF